MLNGAWYYNSGSSTSGVSGQSASSWDSGLNNCYSYAKTSAFYGRADAWCDLGNQFVFQPSQPAGTLVPVNIQVEGNIRGRVLAAGSGKSEFRVILQVFDLTAWSEYAKFPIGTWTNPSAGWTDAIVSYSKTGNYQLVSGHTYIAFVGEDTYADSVDIAYVAADASPLGPTSLTDKRVDLLRMTFTVN